MAQIQRPRSAAQAGRAPQRRHEVSSEFAQGSRRPAAQQPSAAATPKPAHAEKAGAKHVFLGKTLNGRGDMQSLLL